MDRIKLALGWACYRMFLLMPVFSSNSRLYMWLLSWAGFYAYHPKNYDA